MSTDDDNADGRRSDNYYGYERGFTLGLSSLSAIRFAGEIYRVCDLRIPVAEILRMPAIRSLAAWAEQSADGGKEQLSPYPKRERYPITENQRGIIIDWEQNRGTTQYNIPQVTAFDGVEGEALASAVKAALSAHEYLKTRFVYGHRAMLNFIHFIRKRWHLAEKSRIVCHSTFSFDASVEDLYPALTVGGCVCIVPEEARRDIVEMKVFLKKHDINGGSYSTQFGQLLASDSEMMDLDYMCVGGEAMTRTLNVRGPVYNEAKDVPHLRRWGRNIQNRR